MRSFLASLRERLAPADAFLALGAVVCLVAYVVLLPTQHPDASVDLRLGEQGAVQKAKDFLGARGYVVEEDRYDVRLVRERSLLHALQRTLSRPGVVRVLREEGDRLPVYYWRVRFYERTGDETTARYTVFVTQAGRIRHFDVEADAAARSLWAFRIDRSVVEDVFTVPESSMPLAEPDSLRISSVSDSALSALLRFQADGPAWQYAQPGEPDSVDYETVFASLRNRLGEIRPGPGRATSPVVGLPPAIAVAMARYHLRHTPWDTDAFRLDSAWVPAGRDNRVAHVRFLRSDPMYGQKLQVDVEVTAGGSLQELDVAFDSEDGASDTVHEMASIVSGVAYGLLSLLLIVGFFKRLGARLIDGRAMRLDAIVTGVLMMVFLALMFLGEGDLQGEPESPALVLLFGTIGVVISGAATGLFVMIISGAVDSMAREAGFSDRLRAAGLLRLGSFRNVYVGAALVRGALLAAVLLGVVSIGLLLFPQAGLYYDDGHLIHNLAVRPMVGQAAMAGVGAYLVVLFLLGVSVFAYRRKRRAWFVVGSIVVTAAVLKAAFLDLMPAGYSWGISALVGMVLGLALWYTDLLAVFTALFLAMVGWSLSEGWLMEASPVWLDVVLFGLLWLGILVFGLVGVAGGREGRQVVEYVPDYVRELTQQERLKRELEIARHVQASLLPRKMPEVEGLDIAAMCLAALEVGGDYYDFVTISPGKLAVVVGDVSGKGTQAAFYMTLTKGIIQTLSREGLPPADVMRRLNALFCDNVPRGTFVSLIYGVFDVEAGTFTFARAGHNPVILKRSPSRTAEQMRPAGLAIGLASGAVFDTSIEQVTVSLRVGDVLVFYTDGFSEAMNRHKDLYRDDRLAEKVAGAGQRTASEILRTVAEDVHHFVEEAGRHDDMTMVVVKFARRTGTRTDGALGRAKSEPHPVSART